MLKLLCFGPLELQGCRSPRVSSQHLLLVSHVRLEGPQPRWALASLFWPHLAGEFTKKGERKDLSNLGVVLANLRSACGLDLDQRTGLEDLPCDALEFETALHRGDLEGALERYARGPFLAGIEHRPRLRLSAELEDWVAARRQRYDGQARAAMVQLATQALTARQPERARTWAEHAARISGPCAEVGVLDELGSLLTRLESPLAGAVQRSLRGSLHELEAQLSPDAFRYYLLLSLQDVPNSSAAQQAARLSTREAAQCMEQLIDAGVLTPQGQLQPAAAQQHFAAHPFQKLTLLLELRDHTPPEHAWRLYSELYRLSGNFGGIGYWTRARQAYCLRARALLGEEHHEEAARLLDEFEQAERQNQQPPHADNRFLQAYALERLGQRVRGLEVLAGVGDSPEVQAMRSALLVQLEDHHRADELAHGVLEGEYGEASTVARALALNSLGQSSYSTGQYLEAERRFEQSAILWAVAGQPRREIGGLMNRATALQQLRRHSEVSQLYLDLLRRVGEDALRVRILLNQGYLAEQVSDWPTAHGHYLEARDLGRTLGLTRSDPSMMATVLNNLGYAEHWLGDPHSARSTLQEALTCAQGSGDQLRYAIALGNLGVVERGCTKLEMAISLLREVGQPVYAEQYTELYISLLETLLAEARMAGRQEEHQELRARLKGLHQRAGKDGAGLEPVLPGAHQG